MTTLPPATRRQAGRERPPGGWLRGRLAASLALAGSVLLLAAGAFGAPRGLNARLLPLGGLALGAVAYLSLARAGRAAGSGVGEERFRRLVEGSWDGILLIDEQTRVHFASDAMQRILGFDAAELT
ncbi:MAG: PAS domain-containing protein, partial [Gammaproteobacteria bacterium]|nr:PAS domain-containing protein [Gammaproteobacteria bacterium]